MKKILPLLVSVICLLFAQQGYAQCTRDMRYGYSIPVTNQESEHHIVRILIVFAEVDYTGAPEGTDAFTTNYGNTWDLNHDGVSEIPVGADELCDYQDIPDPKGIITKTYSEATFGQYKVLGDYYPKVVKVPYKNLGSSPYNHAREVIRALNKLPDDPAGSGTLTTQHGLTLSDFDLWDWNENTDFGLPKTFKTTPGSGPHKAADIFLILWRNNIYMYYQPTAKNLNDSYCYAGFGLIAVSDRDTLKNLTEGVQTAASYETCGGNAVSAAQVFLVEFLHGVFGPNNWHSGGGAGTSTFLANPLDFSLTSQQGTMIAACGFDRWAMQWGNPKKKFVTSVLDSTGTNEIESGNFSLDNPAFKNGGTFILRDHVTVGDAIRIKLPYLHTLSPAVCNQYLWLENRRFIASTDDYLNEVECADNKDIKGVSHPRGVPGMYAYIQVGKDVRCGTNSSFYTNAPNDKMNWLMPVTAEGNFDFNYRPDMIDCTKNQPWLCGNWGNANIPIDKSKSVPNALTGFSHLYDFYDTDGDGKLHSPGDGVQPGLSVVVKDTAGIHNAITCNGEYIWHNLNCSGDYDDGYSAASGHTRLNISTNPSPFPVYTYHGINTFSGPNTAPPDNTENRTIWLNGLSIEVLSEDALKDGTGAIKIKIRWDDFTIKNDVRWCGNIELSPTHLPIKLPLDEPSEYALNVSPHCTVLLDRGKSPTQYKEFEPGYFTTPTCMTAEPNAYFHLEAKSHLHITAGSTLELMTGSKLELSPGTDIIIDNGGKLVINEGAEVQMPKGAAIKVEQAGTIELYNTTAGKGIVTGKNGKAGTITVKGKILVGDAVSFNNNSKNLFHFKKTGTAVRGSGVRLAGK